MNSLFASRRLDVCLHWTRNASPDYITRLVQIIAHTEHLGEKLCEEVRLGLDLYTKWQGDQAAVVSTWCVGEWIVTVENKIGRDFPIFWGSLVFVVFCASS